MYQLINQLVSRSVSQQSDISQSAVSQSVSQVNHANMIYFNKQRWSTLCNSFNIFLSFIFCFYSDIWLSLLNVPVLPSEIRRSRTVLDDTSLRALFSQTNSTRESSINLNRSLTLISWCYLFDTRIFDDICNFWYSCTSSSSHIQSCYSLYTFGPQSFRIKEVTRKNKN